MSGTIVAAQVLSHTAFVNTHRSEADSGQAARFFAGCEEAARRLRAAAPDVVVMIGTDHFNNFGPGEVPAISVGTGRQHSGPVASEALLAAPRDQQGAPELAWELVAGLLAGGVAVARDEGLALDHSLLVPLELLGINPLTPVVPIYQNCVAEPMLSLAGCWAFGEALATAIARLDGDLKVAVIGTGGLSHWVGTPEQGEINQVWDVELLDLCRQGRLAECLTWPDERVREEAGNGAHELRNWLATFAAAGGAPAEVLAYEPVTAWLTGMAVADVRC